eukprot:g7914.t1
MEGSSQEGEPPVAVPPGDPRLSVALTLVSTEAGGFQEEEVAPVAAATALAFLASPDRASSRFPGLRVVLAAEEGSAALKALRDHVPALAKARQERRLLVKACALPDVSQAGAPCAYLINPCNWRLAAGGSRTNVLVNRAAGNSLQQGSLEGGRKRAVTAEPIPVKLSPGSPLRARGGVDTVIQVLGPNLDPRFPDCLADDLEQARVLLRQCYDNALSTFWGLASPDFPGCVAASSSGGGSSAAAAAGDDCDDASSVWSVGGGASAAAVAGDDYDAASVGRLGGDDRGGETGAVMESGKKRKRAFPEYRKGLPVPAKGGPGVFWKLALVQYLKDRDGPRSPEMQNEVFYEDDQCLVIYDGYPKARFHLLLLPKPKFLDVKEPKDLRRDQHLSRLRQLHATGTEIAEALSQQGAGVVRCGYHGIPSLQPLHLHIISQDFDSVRIKKLRHYNSFTTGFFAEACWVEARLQERGSLQLDAQRLKALEATPPRCFRCGQRMGNLWVLKEHIRTCRHAIVGSGTPQSV